MSKGLGFECEEISEVKEGGNTTMTNNLSLPESNSGTKRLKKANSTNNESVKYFIKIRNQYIAIRSILAVKHTTPSIGNDGITRSWVITIDPTIAGGSKEPRHSQLWASEDEIGDLIKVLDERTAN